MKTVRTQRWLSALAALLLLATTAMPAVVRMTCLSGGHTVVSLGQAKDCCPEQDHGHGATLHAACCEVDRAALDRTQFCTEGSQTLQLPVFVASSSTDIVFADPLDSYTGYGLSCRPPPLRVIERLSQVHSFLL